ncbi:MAG: NADPH:quinone reductase-like Zn-dependent oxidoreductase [Candidatus Azotimanducaceae bacterium]|jgi:NADPH:quinone reductase-like Zn-dependent oxidoreductase
MIKKMLTKALGKLLVLKVVAIFLLTLSAVHARAYQQIVINEYGPPNVMQLVEQAILPEPGAGEVRIKVLAAGVSFTDTMVRKGVYVGVNVEFPFSPGYDLVGVVDKLGPGVEGFAIGQKVADLTVYGAYTQYTVRPIESLVPVPNNLDAVEAVSLVLSYTTAYQMLHRVADLKAGQSVLIHGASGAVGTALAQIGKAAGLTMFGTASTAKQDFVADLGVTPIDYKTEDFVEKVMAATENKGVDVVFDAVSIDNFKRSYSTLKPGGRLITYGFYSKSLSSQAGDSFQIIKEFLKWKWLQLRWSWFPTQGRSAEFYSITDLRAGQPTWFKEDLAALFELLANGEIAPKIWKTFPLSEASQAHQLLEQGKVRGKIVLKIAE